MRPLAIGLMLLLGSAAFAEAPSRSLLPPPRPDWGAVAVVPTVEAPVVAVPAGGAPVVVAPVVPRPMPRPVGLVVVPPVAEVAPVVAAGVAVPRPMPRPDGLQLAAARVAEPILTAKERKKKKKSVKGSVCNDPDILGEVLSPITSKVKGCGIDAPVRVTAIDGIRLNQPATINCDTAAAFKTWIEKAMKPAFGKREVIELRIAASYACRPRNNVRGAKVSEHGRGKAVDVAGFVFADGKEWSIARDYNKEIRKAHKGACGIFGTTLGPGSDGFHEDHLHFDIASYRGGPYCR